MVLAEGFEPPIPDPQSGVLPLHQASSLYDSFTMSISSEYLRSWSGRKDTRPGRGSNPTLTVFIAAANSPDHERRYSGRPHRSSVRPPSSPRSSRSGVHHASTVRTSTASRRSSRRRRAVHPTCRRSCDSTASYRWASCVWRNRRRPCLHSTTKPTYCKLGADPGTRSPFSRLRGVCITVNAWSTSARLDSNQRSWIPSPWDETRLSYALCSWCLVTESNRLFTLTTGASYPTDSQGIIRRRKDLGPESLDRVPT